MRIGPATCGSARQPRRALAGVQPAAQVGERVEAADDPVPARAAGGAEYLFAEVAGEGPGRAPDAGQGLLVGRPCPA